MYADEDSNSQLFRGGVVGGSSVRDADAVARASGGVDHDRATNTSGLRTTTMSSRGLALDTWLLGLGTGWLLLGAWSVGGTS